MGLILPLLVTLPQSATAMIAASLMFAVVITASFFLLAYFFQSPQITAMAHEELAALIFTGFIILFWVAGDGFFNGITNGAIGATAPALPEGTPPPELSVGHVQFAIAATDIFRSKVQSLYISLYLYEVLIGFLSTISFPIGTLFPGPAIISFSLMPFIALSMLSGAHTTVVESIGLVMAMIWVKEFILLFCRDIVPLILLPVGLVLRAFPLSRTTGSSIISVCFATYFVFPLAVLFSYYMIFDVYEPTEAPPVPSVITIFKTHMSEEEGTAMVEGARGKSHEMEEIFGQTPIAETAATTSVCSGNELLCSLENIGRFAYDLGKGFITTVKNIWLFMMGFMGDFHQGLWDNPMLPSNVASGLYYFIIKEVSHVAQFIVLVVITSVIEIIITITMYRNISMIIGGEMELAGITKIV